GRGSPLPGDRSAQRREDRGEDEDLGGLADRTRGILQGIQPRARASGAVGQAHPGADEPGTGEDRRRHRTREHDRRRCRKRLRHHLGARTDLHRLCPERRSASVDGGGLPYTEHVSSRRRTTCLLLALAAVALVTLPWALFTSRADLTFGPHEAQYRVTADSRLTVDFGPLGELLVPAEDYIPLGLGLHVDIGEIPVS